MHRRTVLRLAGGGAAALVAAGCDRPGPAKQAADRPTRRPTRHAYGEDPSQYGELHLPPGDPRGVVVVLHGGFWQASYGADALGTPLARSLAANGWAAWNLEYRRVGRGSGGGGGAPATFDDIAAGIDLLTTLDLDTSTVVALGHSAGGHLAAWSAARGRYGWPEEVPVTQVVSQAGVLDLRAGQDLGAGAVRALLGHPPTEADARFDPAQQLPLAVPVWCVHDPDDDVVPIEQSRSYVRRARAAGADVRLVEVDGGHFDLIDPESSAWARQLEILDGLGRRASG